MQNAIVMWSGSLANIPSGWVLCDGTNGTPDLRSRFIAHAGQQLFYSTDRNNPGWPGIVTSATFLTGSTSRYANLGFGSHQTAAELNISFGVRLRHGHGTFDFTTEPNSGSHSHSVQSLFRSETNYTAGTTTATVSVSSETLTTRTTASSSWQHAHSVPSDQLIQSNGHEEFAPMPTTNPPRTFGWKIPPYYVLAFIMAVE